MKYILKYLKPYRKECILAPAFKMLEAVFELLIPLVVASIIDKGIGMQDRYHIIRCCAVMITLGAVGLISAVSAQYMAAGAATGFASGLRSDLFAHIMSLSHKNIDELGTSAMITRITSDVNQTQTGVNMFLRLFLRSPFVVFGAMIMAFTIDAGESLIFLGVIVVLFVIVGLVMHFNIPLLKRVQDRLDRVTLLTRENLTGVRVIRAFTMEENEKNSFYGSNRELLDMQMKAGHLSAALNPMTFTLINFAIIILIYTGALKVNSGTLTRGMVVALYNYMSQILVELIKLANLIVLLNKAVASGDRVEEIFKIKPAIEDCADTDKAAVKDAKGGIDKAGKGPGVCFEHVSLKYSENGDEALTDISFTAQPGETIGIIGGTGSGKSSVVNLIPRFYDVTAGRVLVDNMDVREYDARLLRSSVGIVPQKAVLFAGTIADNLRWGNENASDDELNEAVRIACCSEVVSSKGGLDSPVEPEGRNFSGGQRQRLTIARALVRRPGILILDDSSSALDNITDKKLRENLKDIGYDPTVFIVAQRTSSVMNADRIVVLDDGCVEGIGTHEELLKSCKTYREIFEANEQKEYR
ncbi:MAG: ABC transporter ATP-binding protein/permease [Lachnospiraceae bacterium]|nr:ABC transporter ATP-binding protein/permease [Lachnospiraceae bacterium]